MSKDEVVKLESMYDNLKPFLKNNHIEKTEQVAELLMILHRIKESGYKGSFAKRGELGIFHNLARKWDRIETAYSYDNSFNDVSTLDAIADLAVYAIKWMAVFVAIHGDTFKKWLSKMEVTNNENWNVLLKELYSDIPIDPLDPGLEYVRKTIEELDPHHKRYHEEKSFFDMNKGTEELLHDDSKSD